MPTPAQVSTLAGRELSTQQVDAALSVVTALARSYCRASWDDDDLPADVDAVVQTSVLRFLHNPGQLPHAETTGAFSVDYRGAWVGWTLPELAVLYRYRVRAV